MEAPSALLPFFQNIGLEVDIEGIFTKVKLQALRDLYTWGRRNRCTSSPAKVAMKCQCILPSRLHAKITATTVEWTLYTIVAPYSFPSIKQLYSADAARLIPIEDKDRACF